MGRQIIKQPNGLYALWSSVVDDFVMLDATPEEIIEDAVEDSRKEITARVKDVVAKLGKGGRPYFQRTKSFDECVERIKELHGPEAETLGILRQGKMIP